MSLNWPKSSPNAVAEYQLSGVPYVTQSNATAVASSGVAVGKTSTVTPTRLDFPFVTRWIQVENIGATDMRFGFTENGVKGNGEGKTWAHNYITLQAPEASNADTRCTTMRLELRCRTLYFLGENSTTGFQVIAGLTSVPAVMFPILTGSSYEPRVTGLPSGSSGLG